MKPQYDFKPFPKMARLNRNIIITEKIDGTNASVHITEEGEVYAASRTRWITPEEDNHGFAAWVRDNKKDLLGLGVGAHFGEWWGGKIQRGYGCPEKRFSLFNATRWVEHDQEPKRIQKADSRVEKWQERAPKCCHVVPVLYRGLFYQSEVEYWVEELKGMGSIAYPEFPNPEGIVIFHEAAQTGFKVTIKNDEVPKFLSEKR